MGPRKARHYNAPQDQGIPALPVAGLCPRCPERAQHLLFMASGGRVAGPLDARGCREPEVSAHPVRPCSAEACLVSVPGLSVSGTGAIPRIWIATRPSAGSKRAADVRLSQPFI
jgi:hypothetical protein